MISHDFQADMSAVIADPTASRDARRLVYEFGNLMLALDGLAESADTPQRTVVKIRAFRGVLEEKAVEHGATFYRQAFLLNFVGEAMARANYVGKPVLDFLNLGLYFYGLDWVERTQRARSMEFMLAHAECLSEFVARAGIKAQIAIANEKFEADRPYCIIHQYTNALKKRYWADRRKSEDACDVSVSLDAVQESYSASSSSPTLAIDSQEDSSDRLDSTDRVLMMLDIFEHSLSSMQQMVYLARHPLTGRFSGHRSELGDELQAMIREMEGADKSTWKELSAQFGVTEKTIKREYLRGLLILLSESSERVFGDRRPSNFVRRMQETLRSIVQERDLRIRDNAGRGLTKIVARWELSLRFVLNHARKTSDTAVGGDFDWSREAI